VTETKTRNPGPVVDPPKPLGDVLTLIEMADLFGVQRVTVNQWRMRRRAAADPDMALPEPDDYLGAWPVWRLSRIEQWARKTGRPYDVERWRAKRDAGDYQRDSKTGPKPTKEPRRAGRIARSSLSAVSHTVDP
jgi:hypothetical protein